MNDILPVSCRDAGANRLDQFKRAHCWHRAFLSHDVLKRFALHKLHYQERHRAAHHAKICHRDNVLMSNRRGGERFLSKAGYQIRIVAEQVGKDDLYRVLSL